MIFLSNRHAKNNPDISVLRGLREYVLHERLARVGVGGLTQQERDDLFNILRKDYCAAKGTGSSLSRFGWVINFHDWLAEFFVEFDIGEGERILALDEQSIRNHNWHMYTIVSIVPGSLAPSTEREHDEENI